MRRYLARKVFIYLVTFWVAVTIDWAIPRLMPGDPIDRLLSRMQAQPSSAEALTGYYTKAFGFDVPALAPVPQLLGGALPRRPRPERRELPDAGLGAHPERTPVHARAARPRHRPQLLGREQGRRTRRPSEDARQHGATGGLRAHSDAADVARHRARLGIRIDACHLPRLGCVRPRASAVVVARVRTELPPPLGPPLRRALLRRLRRLGDRHAKHDHLRTRGRLLQLPRGSGRPEQAGAQVRVPKRAAPADHWARTRARRSRRGRHRRRDRVLLSRSRAA